MSDLAPTEKDRTRLMRLVKPDPTGCWLWQGYIGPTGYGQAWLCGRRIPSHRAIYILLTGPIPAGLQLDHLCRVPRCVNPSHLEPVTPRENTLRGDTLPARNAVKTACVRGHEFTPENTGVNNRGQRFCRICTRAYNSTPEQLAYHRAWRAKRKEMSR